MSYEKPRKSKRKTFLIVSLAGIIVAIPLMLYGIISIIMPGEIKIEPGRNTTYITGPLDAEGNVDFLAYLNESLSAGATADNNAAVDLAAIAGPGDRDQATIAEQTRLLGVDPYQLIFPKYYPLTIELDTHIEELGIDAVLENEDEAVFKWLDQNDEALDAVVTAFEKPEFYMPLVAPSELPTLMMLPIESLQEYRSIALGLKLRCRRALHEGDIDAALSDARVLQQLATVCKKSPFLIGQAVAMAIDELAIDCEREILQSQLLDDSDLQDFARRQLETPVALDGKHACGLGERLMALDAAIAMTDPDAAYFLGEEGQSELGALEFARGSVDWNLALEEVNAWYDELAACFDEPGLSDQRQAVSSLESRLEQLSDDLVSWSFITSRKYRSRRIGQTVVSLLMPSAGMIVERSVLQKTEREVIGVAAALEAYRAQHQVYPTNLNQLSPDFLPDVPVDRLNQDRPLNYSSDGTAFKLYSYGLNRADDQGDSTLYLGHPSDIVITSPSADKP